MTSLQSRPSAQCRSPASGRQWSLRTRLRPALLAGLIFASPLLWAWNPYDTDSGWSSAPRDSADGWRRPSEAGSWSETRGDRSWREQQRSWRADAPPAWDAPRYQVPTDSDGYARYSAGGYQFRHDPKLEAQHPSGQHGWEFRPLSEREHSRSLADSPYPPIDERDYLPRGPWRSYQDEGTAFGYHADDQWPSDSTQPPLR